jgi:hypothetical protein
MFSRLMGTMGLMACAFVMFASVGCNQPSKTGDNKQAKNDADKKKDILKDDHSGWWCQEHGIPEHLCSLCSTEVFEKYKKEGKLCKLHPDRAEEQCFKCDPSRYKKYEEMHVAKFGKKPEPPPESEFKK